jgi:arylsulfatase A-like enzyme
VVSSHAAPSQPNIIIFLVDDMGVMDTSLAFLTDEAGKPTRYPLNDYYRTPNMERLAGRGIRFNNFHAMSFYSPTRIALLTGQNATRHRTTNWIDPDTDNAGPQGAPDWNWHGLKPGGVTLPGLLGEAGYRTIHVGKASGATLASVLVEPVAYVAKRKSHGGRRSVGRRHGTRDS